MIAFFEDNNISPNDTFGNNMTSFTNVLNKRLDAVISIIRTMEKTQLVPIRKKLESLFEGEKKEEKKLILEKKVKFNPQELSTENKVGVLPNSVLQYPKKFQ